MPPTLFSAGSQYSLMRSTFFQFGPPSHYSSNSIYHPMDPSQGRQEKQIRDKERHTAILAGASAVTPPAVAVELDF
eukprot:15367173-Ditylum_brightwellii.AAC.1